MNRVIMPALISSVIFLLVACSEKSVVDSFSKQVSEKVIGPSYVEFSKQTVALSQKTRQCVDTQDHSLLLEELKFSWSEAMLAWQAVQWIKFGPIKENNREWQIQFWPDKKNIIGRKVNALLKKPEVDHESLQKSGILVQGLSAMEYVLYDEKAVELSSDSQRCHLLGMMADSLSDVAIDISDEWKTQEGLNHYVNTAGVTTIVTHEAIGKNSITDPDQRIIILVNSLIQFVEVVVDQKVATPFALTKQKKLNSYFLESWRSETSLTNLKENTNALMVLLNDGGLKDYLYSVELGILADAIEDELEFLIKLHEQHDENFVLEKVSVDSKELDTIIKPVFQHWSNLQRLIKGDLVKALNIPLGFNANDGDS